MKIKIKEFRKLLASVAEKYVSKEEARYFAQEVVETDIRKVQVEKYSQGIINDIEAWKNKTNKIKKSIDLPSFTQYNFNELGLSLKIKEIHDELEKKASKNGIAMVSNINSSGMHTLHLWTQGLAKRGLFALAGWNGGPDAVVPFNGTKGILGTNPLSYGFPSDKGEVVIDLATSEIPFYKIKDAKKNNTTLPKNAAVDDHGEITTDPKKALDENEVSNLLPMGANYKGYIINYLREIMTSALVGAKCSSEMNDYVEKEHGGFIIAIAIDKVTDVNNYNKSIGIINEEIRSHKPKRGVDKVIVPGDNNLERKKGLNDECQIEISDEYKKALDELLVS